MAFWAFMKSCGDPISNSGLRLSRKTVGTLNFPFKVANTQTRCHTPHRKAVHLKPSSKL